MRRLLLVMAMWLRGYRFVVVVVVEADGAAAAAEVAAVGAVAVVVVVVVVAAHWEGPAASPTTCDGAPAAAAAAAASATATAEVYLSKTTNCPSPCHPEKKAKNRSSRQSSIVSVAEIMIAPWDCSSSTRSAML
ncbi:hypothetical protein U6O80_12335, partial [Cutibacterium acnes]